MKFKEMKGVSSAQLPLHLDERERYGQTAGQAFTNVCADIGMYDRLCNCLIFCAN